MNPEEFHAIGEQEREARSHIRRCVRVCGAAGCRSCGSHDVAESLRKSAAAKGLKDDVSILETGCMGLCSAGPLALVDDDTLYRGVKPGDADEILEGLDKGPVERLACPLETPFFQRQMPIVLENSGRIDPENLEDALAHGAYQSLFRTLTEMGPDDVVQIVMSSGLRGRGGAGYPTGLKWSTVAKAVSETKYVVCNADEGDPGAFMDRSVLESDPHRVLEGMAVAGYAVGAAKGYVYVRAEYPLAIKRLEKAIAQARKIGLFGNRIFDSRFNFDIEIRLGAGAFVCGEETALMASIEGRRGSPRPRPPYPAQRGLWGSSTLINNVETYANIAPIVRRGPEWFAAIGTEKSKGTKVFALAGSVVNTGLIEVPMGITLREIIFDIGGGVPNGRRFKAVQTGGPSGGCIPESLLDIPVDYESLVEAGSIMGSGGMIVMDDSSCMVDVARFFMDFCRSESCGKCVPCRAGTEQMYESLRKISRGEAVMADLAALEELSLVVQETSLCGLGQTSPNPLLSTLRHFRHEYEAHIEGRLCAAGACALAKKAEAAP